jgi:hypothetical protein
MKKYKFIIRKYQDAAVEENWDPNESVEDVAKRIEKLSDEDLNYSDPEYQLIGISKDHGKISKLLWLLKSS